MYLAQFNIARLRAPLDSPKMLEFVQFLEPLNAYAEQCPGFVWRLTDDSGRSATYVESPYDDPMIAPNLTVWRDVESLFHFTYKTVHAHFLKNRKQWLERPEGRHFVLWWIPEDERPTLLEAKAKLDRLRAEGPSPEAFPPRHLYDANGERLVIDAVKPGSKSRPAQE